MYCARLYVCVCVGQSRGILRSSSDVDAAFKCATFFYVAAAAAAFAWLPSAHKHTRTHTHMYLQIHTSCFQPYVKIHGN